jgi:hypothetical protein
LVVTLVLGALAGRHPGLRLVDAIGFSHRAERLVAGLAPGDGLYPNGFPALVALGHAACGDALLAMKAISVLAGGLLAAVVGPFALASPAALQWGSTEGTDMLAAALSIAGVTRAKPWPLVSGVLVGLATGVRWTGLAGVPVVLAMGGPRALAGVLAGLAPHAALGLLTSGAILPDQGMNLEIAAGRPTALWSVETARRWPQGAMRALLVAGEAWPVRVAALGLAVGAWRRDRAAIGLLGLGLAHVALLGVGFANPRLALPTTLCAAAGARWLAPRWLVALAALAVAGWAAPAAWTVPVAESRLAAIVQEAGELPGPFLATSPWFHSRRSGWLEPSIQVSGLGLGRDATVEALRQAALREGAPFVALEAGRMDRDHPPWRGLYRDGAPGFSLAAQEVGWKVFLVEPEPLEAPPGFPGETGELSQGEVP